MSEEEKELTLVERCILVTLMIKATPLPQTYLTNVARIGLKADHRRKLKSLKLIEVTEKPITLALTTDGWRRAAEELRADAPKGAGSPGGALYVALDFLRQLIDYLGVGADDLFRLQIDGRDTISTLANAPSTVPSVAATKDIDVTTRVRLAYRELAAKPGDYVMLSELRSVLADLARTEVDAALIRLNTDRNVHLVPESNQKVLRPEERTAAVNIGNQDKHLIAISS